MSLNDKIAKAPHVLREVRPALYREAVLLGEPDDPVVFVNALDFRRPKDSRIAVVMVEAEDEGAVACQLFGRPRGDAREEMRPLSARAAGALARVDPQHPIIVLIMTSERPSVLHLADDDEPSLLRSSSPARPTPQVKASSSARSSGISCIHSPGHHTVSR